MKLLKRNMTCFEYIPPLDEMSDLNEDNEHTGEFHPVYGDPIPYKGNISIPSGQVQHQFYGMDIRYTHTLLMDDPNVDINERGLVRWKDNLYDVTAVRPSLNVLSVALKQQTPEGSGGEEEPDDYDDNDDYDDDDDDGEEDDGDGE